MTFRTNILLRPVIFLCAACFLSACPSPQPPQYVPEIGSDTSPDVGPEHDHYHWSVEARVVLVEPSYLPRIAHFQIDETGGDCNDGLCCPAGTWLYWAAPHAPNNSKDENVMTTHNLLTSALISGRRIRAYGYDKLTPEHSNCEVRFIHLLVE